jgi:AAA15 family ATPase/GTPase
MLVEFSISNIFSFKEKTTFSLTPAKLKERDEKIDDNINVTPKGELLKSAAIYGANASGKTNLIKALSYFIDFIVHDSKYLDENDSTAIKPFLLNSLSKHKPSTFDITLLENDFLLKYKIELNETEVLHESLSIKKERKTLVFNRDKDRFEIAKKYKIMAEISKKKLIPRNSLLLTKAALFNEKIASRIIKSLKNLLVISGIRDIHYRRLTILLMNNKEFKDNVTDLMKFADHTILDIEANQVEKLNPNKLEMYIKKGIYNDKKEIVDNYKFNLNEDESEGTKKFFYISGPIIESLNKGYTLFVDELDTKLHPLLVEKIIGLFHNPEINKNNAQLVFTTHNTALLGLKTFRRDQIWLVEKSKYGESDLYSLLDFGNGVRNDESIEKRYLMGKYGAIPLT